MDEPTDKQIASTPAKPGRWGKTAIIAGAAGAAGVIIGAVVVAAVFHYGPIDALNCASKETQELVIQITGEHENKLVGSLGAQRQNWNDVRREIKYSLNEIRTTDKNLAGALTCAASLKGDAGKYGADTLSITYKVEKTSDGKLYVGVYGLCPEYMPHC